jgi:hypothetical protein
MLNRVLLVSVACALLLGTYASLRPIPSTGPTDPAPLALKYLKDLAASNGLVIDKTKILAVRTNDEGSVLLVKIRFHVKSVPGFTQDETLRVRLSRSLWSVTDAELVS